MFALFSIRVTSVKHHHVVSIIYKTLSPSNAVRDTFCLLASLLLHWLAHFFSASSSIPEKKHIFVYIYIYSIFIYFLDTTFSHCIAMQRSCNASLTQLNGILLVHHYLLSEGCHFPWMDTYCDIVLGNLIHSGIKEVAPATTFNNMT